MSISNPSTLSTPVTTSTEAAITSGTNSPSQGELVLGLFTLGTSNSAGATTLSVADTMGSLPWSSIIATKGTSGNLTISAIFYAFSPSGTSGTLTVTPSLTGAVNAGMAISVYGVNGAGAIRQKIINTSGGLSASFGNAPVSNSLILALYATILGGDPSETIPSSHTALFTDRHEGVVTYDTGSYENGAGATTLTWGGTNSGNSAITALEILPQLSAGMLLSV